MVPVNGKPVIGWILDDLIDKGVRSATVVLRAQDYRLRQFLQRTYARRMQLATASLQQEGTIIQSVQAGLRSSPAQGTVRIILGDTLIRDSYHGDENFVYVRTVEDSRRWCLAMTSGDQRIIDYIDKQENVPPPRLALAGYYHFLDGKHLQACVDSSVADGERELSAVLRRYGTVSPIFARPVAEWYDFGNIDNLVDARRRLLRPRFFNTLTINPTLNTITKISDHDQKLRDELNWYLQLPDELKVLTPRIVSHHETNGRLEIVQEYYGYPTLAELYIYGDLSPETWTSILRHILDIHKEFRRYPGVLNPADVSAVYVGKTWERLELLRTQDAGWKELLERSELQFNGRRLRGVLQLREKLDQRAQALANSGVICIVHGDFCLSNILFDIGSQIIRLIDPRGNFGQRGVYGDARYDIAKLRHSLCGLYDYILADMFEFEESDKGFKATVFSNGTQRVVGGTFDRLVEDAGYNLNDIRFLEGLLFISMLPLHHGHPRRQRMMYLTGLNLLNEVLGCAS
jgi:dTDP-glucose pyrophosphorylase